MGGLDKRAPFTATGGMIPPEFQNVKTPCYILDEKALIKNAKLLGEVSERTGCKMLLAQKAFSNYDCYRFFEPYLAGTEASGLFEARLGAEEMPGKEVHVFCAGYRADEFEELLQYADHIVFNSPSQLLRFGAKAKVAGKIVGLRINPEYSDVETDLYNPCAPGSRMGVTGDLLGDTLPEGIEGLHFHTLCESTSYDLERTLAEVERRFGRFLPHVKWLNMGGGHLMTRKDYDVEHLIALLKGFKERYPNLELIMEPGSAFAWQTGFLLTTVVDIVENHGIKTAIIDASFTCHMPDCLEMPYKPAIRFATDAVEGKPTYRIGGNSCLSGDYMGDWSFDKPLEIGDKLIFEDMIHYTIVKTNMFNGIPHPSLALWSKDDQLVMYRTFGYEDYKNRMD